MPLNTKPRILIVDDDPDGQARALKTDIGKKAVVEVTHPEELVDLRKITEADLILVDYVLDNWEVRDEIESLCQKPMDGLALASVLRSLVDKDKYSSPTAIAILSGHLDGLSKPLPPEPRVHTLARTNNLEWIFPKKQSYGHIPLSDQVVELALAVRQLPPSWPLNNFEETKKQIQSLLALSGKEIWSRRAWLEIEDCNPPIHELSKWTHGLAILRWLSQRILSYPCFLWDSHHLAARLRISYSSLISALENNGKLAHTFERVRYKGVLSGFIGKRWWRSGVEALLWKKTSGNSQDPDAIHKFLSSFGKQKLKQSKIADPIVCVDKNYEPIDDAFSRDQAVRLQPDDWPPYADQAWTTFDLAKEENSLGALVIKEDRDRIQ